MTRQFMSSLAEVEWWPSPTHFAVFSLAAAAANGRPRETREADGALTYRVQCTLGDIAAQLNISTRTVGRTFADFAAMRIMYSGGHGRRWHIDARAARPERLERHLQQHWEGSQRAMRRAERAEIGEPRQHVEDVASEVQWYEEWTPAEDVEPGSAPAEVNGERGRELGLEARNGHRPMDAILHPLNPPDWKVRLTSAIAAAASSLALDPTIVDEWWRAGWGDILALGAMLERSRYATVQDWMADHVEEIRAHALHLS